MLVFENRIVKISLTSKNFQARFGSAWQKPLPGAGSISTRYEFLKYKLENRIW